MKYFLIIFISLILLSAQPALAVKMVKGTVPQVQSLQPPPASISRNVQGNIQYQDSFRQPATGSPDQTMEPSPSTSSLGVQNGLQANPEGVSSQSRLIWLLVIFAILLLGGWWLIKRNNNE